MGRRVSCCEFSLVYSRLLFLLISPSPHPVNHHGLSGRLVGKVQALAPACHHCNLVVCFHGEPLVIIPRIGAWLICDLRHRIPSYTQWYVSATIGNLHRQQFILSRLSLLFRTHSRNESVSPVEMVCRVSQPKPGGETKDHSLEMDIRLSYSFWTHPRHLVA